MIFDISDTGGLIRLGSFSLLWQNPDEEYPGFTVFNYDNYSLELGDIDAGNGIFLTKFDGEGDIEYIKQLVKLS